MLSFGDLRRQSVCILIVLSHCAVDQVLLSLGSPTRTEPLVQSSLKSEPTADEDAGTAGAETQMCLSLTNTLPHVYRGITQYLAIKQPDSLLHSSVFTCFISLFTHNMQCRTAVSPPLSLLPSVLTHALALRTVSLSCPQSCCSALFLFSYLSSVSLSTNPNTFFLSSLHSPVDLSLS